MYFIYKYFIHLHHRNKQLKFIIMKANRSQIFSQAWTLFRKYNITFAQALKKAWTDFKRQFYVSIYNSIPSKPSTAKKKLEAKKMYEQFNTVDFALTFRSVESNSNAAAYYDGHTLNLD